MKKEKRLCKRIASNLSAEITESIMETKNKEDTKMDVKKVVGYLLAFGTVAAIKLYGDKRHQEGWVKGVIDTTKAWKNSQKEDSTEKEEA